MYVQAIEFVFNQNYMIWWDFCKWKFSVRHVLDLVYAHFILLDSVCVRYIVFLCRKINKFVNLFISRAHNPKHALKKYFIWLYWDVISILLPFLQISVVLISFHIATKDIKHCFDKKKSKKEKKKKKKKKKNMRCLSPHIFFEKVL